MTANKKKAAVLSNITVDLIAARLKRKYDIYIPEGFNTWMQEVLNPESGLYRENCDAVFVLLDGTEARSWKSARDGAEQLDMWKQAVGFLASRIASVPVFVSTIDFRECAIKAYSERKYALQFENDWYQYVQQLAEERDNIFVLDLDSLIRETGRKQFYSNKMWYLSNMPYSRTGMILVAGEMERALRAAFEPRKKLIALDLDNTLWGGVIGEDGVEGIELSDHKEGQRFFDFQRQLLEMKNRGIVLAVNSKNNEEDVEAAIQNHPSMLLRDEDFVSRKINWQSKAQNLNEMSKELNITQGGFVFIDDNPVEREIVKGECPEVLVPDFPEDTTELLGFAEEIWFDHCRPLRVLSEDVKKTRMYQSEMQRKKILGTSLNLEEYIAKLEMKADIHRMRPNEVERVAQLCGKTNQFNLTTHRYDRAQIETFAADPQSPVYVVYASDKYGDSGLVSVLILKKEQDRAGIDTFLMSCRVMGRQLEDVIFNEIAQMMAAEGVRTITGEYAPTAKNSPVSELYDRLGFARTSEEDGHKTYEFSLDGFAKKEFPAYKEISMEV